MRVSWIQEDIPGVVYCITLHAVESLFEVATLHCVGMLLYIRCKALIDQYKKKENKKDGSILARDAYFHLLAAHKPLLYLQCFDL